MAHRIWTRAFTLEVGDRDGLIEGQFKVAFLEGDSPALALSVEFLRLVLRDGTKVPVDWNTMPLTNPELYKEVVDDG